MRRFISSLSFVLIFGFHQPVAAQDAETLADIRQQLIILNNDIQTLKRELSTTGGTFSSGSAGSVLDRLNAIEAQTQQLTGKTEKLEFRINQIVRDGTNRIGDLEFRLVELEGGDISDLGETSILGGGTVPQVAVTAPQEAPQSQLAIGEEADFQRAQEALASGDFRSAAQQFATFNQTYPGGPLAAEADLLRGQALNGAGDTREAARAFLASFGAAPTGPHAPAALLHLGEALGALGQLQEACMTLAEVPVRFANAPEAQKAQGSLQKFSCS